MANTIGTCLSDDWEVLELEGDTRLHIPTTWNISSDSRELNGGGRRIILLDLDNYYYVPIGNIGNDFAIDVYYTTDDEAYEEMMSVFNSFEKGNATD